MRSKGLELYRRVEGRIAALQMFRLRLSSSGLWHNATTKLLFDATYGKKSTPPPKKGVHATIHDNMWL